MTTDELSRIRQCLESGTLPDAELGAKASLTSPALGARLAAAGDPEPEADEPEAVTPPTEDAIATFLDTYGHGSSAEEDALIERLIFNPQPDYAAYLEDSEQQRGRESEPAAAPDAQMAMIDRFLASGPHLPAEDPDAEEAEKEPEPTPIATAPPAPDASEPLGESMARLLIAQGRHKQAFDILSQLNLKYPEKSRYFALQLRFLGRLIENDERRERATKNAENQS